MYNFTFCSPTEFVFGRDTQQQTGELLTKYGARRVLLVSGGSSARRSGLLPLIESLMTQEGIEWVELPGIHPNPTDDRVYEGIDLVRRNNLDFILAVGGGSVIDTAKAVALGVPYQGDFWDFYAGHAKPRAAMPVGVVLTLPGSGSEGSGNSVITRIEGRQKISVRFPDLLRPRFSVMNPELTRTLPWYQTACGVVDMVAHVMERYFSNTRECDVTDGFAEAVMKAVMNNARKLMSDPDNYEARANIMWAGNLAHNGLCGVGKEEDWASHRLEHEISALYPDVAHGAGLAVVIPAWMLFTGSRNPHKMLSFATNVMGVRPGDKATQQVIYEGVSRLRDFYADLGLQTRLTELIGGKPDVKAMVESLGRNMGRTVGSYVPLTMADCEEIYRHCR